MRRLEAAGAVVFGKTNVPVDLADWQSYNPVYGRTANPWDAARTPGGSSGGSAAALAAGLTGLEIGSDIGGSIRVPAHFCGVYGHKPTFGLVPNYGDPALSAAAGTDIAVAGPMARSAADLAVALDVLGGPDPDESGLTLNLPPPRFGSLKELRVAVWAEQPGQTTDPETVAAIDALAAGLERQGAAVSRTARPPFNATEAYHLYLPSAGHRLEHPHARRGRRGPAQAPRRLAGGRDTSADDIMLRSGRDGHRTGSGLNEQRFKMAAGMDGVVPGVGCAAVPGFRHCRLAAPADGGPGSGGSRWKGGKSPTTICVLAGPDGWVSTCRPRWHRWGFTSGRAAAGRADRRADIGGSHDDCRGGAVGTGLAAVQNAGRVVTRSRPLVIAAGTHLVLPGRPPGVMAPLVPAIRDFATANTVSRGWPGQAPGLQDKQPGGATASALSSWPPGNMLLATSLILIGMGPSPAMTQGAPAMTG